MSQPLAPRGFPATSLFLVAAPILVLFLSSCFTTKRRYKTLSAEEFNRYRLASLHFAYPHRERWDDNYRYYDFLVDGEQIDVCLSREEYERADEILTPSERHVLTVGWKAYHAGYKDGWEAGQADKDIEPASPPTDLSASLAERWSGCWRAGYQDGYERSRAEQ